MFSHTEYKLQLTKKELAHINKESDQLAIAYRHADE